MFDNLSAGKSESVDDDLVGGKSVKRRRLGSSELSRLGVDSSLLRSLCSERSSRRKSGGEGKLQVKGENSRQKVGGSGLIDKKKWTWYG